MAVAAAVGIAAQCRGHEELEVAYLHEKTDRIHEEMLDRFMRIEKALGVAPVRKPGTSGEIAKAASSAPTMPRSGD